MAEEEMNCMNDQVMAEEKSNNNPPQKKRCTYKFMKNHRKKWSLVPEYKLMVIIRRGGENDTMAAAHRKLLRSMGLWKLNTGVFAKADETIIARLQRVKPFVTFRYPTPETVKLVIYRYGAIRLDNRITPLTQNNVVEQAFGKYNLLCIEDIVREISNVGSHFKDVVSTLRPFPLNFKKKKSRKGGRDAGTSEAHITELISKVKMTGIS